MLHGCNTTKGVKTWEKTLSMNNKRPSSASLFQADRANPLPIATDDNKTKENELGCNNLKRDKVGSQEIAILEQISIKE